MDEGTLKLASTDYVDELLEGKQDKLTAGKNIEIINNEISSTVDTSLLRALVVQVNKLSKFHDLDPIVEWRKATPADWEKSFGEDGAFSEDTFTGNNKKSGYFLSKDVKAIKFKIGGTSGPGNYLGWLLCYNVGEDLSDARGITMDFNTSTADVYTKWIKCNVAYNSFDGANGIASIAQSKSIFNVHDAEITAEVQDNGTIKLSNGDAEATVSSRTGDTLRLGLGFLNGFCNGMRYYDIKILAPITE